MATGPGWWGEEDGFFLDTTVANPGYEHGFDLVIWIGKDHAHIRVLLDWLGHGDWRLDADYRMEHADLRAYLDSLPKPFTAYGATMMEVDGE